MQYWHRSRAILIGIEGFVGNQQILRGISGKLKIKMHEYLDSYELIVDTLP